ncbi:VOC family protein [Klebsiella michiganensis]
MEALHAEYQAMGVALHQPLTVQDWNIRDFVVRDPDGNLILFASR